MKLRLYKVKGTQSREEPACKHSQATSVLSLTQPASPRGACSLTTSVHPSVPHGPRARAHAPAASPPNTAVPTKCTIRKRSPVSSCPSVFFRLACCVITMFHPLLAQALP